VPKWVFSEPAAVGPADEFCTHLPGPPPVSLSTTANDRVVSKKKDNQFVVMVVRFIASANARMLLSFRLYSKSGSTSLHHLEVVAGNCRTHHSLVYPVFEVNYCCTIGPAM
jgi:hypothetical protein